MVLKNHVAVSTAEVIKTPYNVQSIVDIDCAAGRTAKEDFRKQ